MSTHTEPRMHTGLAFLVAAKRCEIQQLQQLALTSELVKITGHLVHALQRERGLANLFIGSKGQRLGETRSAQIAESQHREVALRACFDQLHADTARINNGARLYSRMAYVLHGLDALPELRQCVSALAWDMERATNAYVRLITGLLAVVFEAADGATDPEISRLLVAMFNFMQGKELAGQERALGAGMLAAGRAQAVGQHRLLHLIESQDHCLQVFTEFATPQLIGLWQSRQDNATEAEHERLRRVLCTASDGALLYAKLSEVWFDCCTRRIDEMKIVEDRLALDLQQVCERKIAVARSDLGLYEARLRPAASPQNADATAAAVGVSSNPLDFFEFPPLEYGHHPAPKLPAAPKTYGPQVERSILELVQEQAHRLQTMSDELETVRASLNERKVIERAKGLLMAHRSLSEADAHKTLRQLAMNQNRRLIDVAEAVLSMATVFPASKQTV